MKKILVFVLLLAACGKKDNGVGGGGNNGGGGNGGGQGGRGALGAGTIFVEWATDGIQKIDLNTGVESTVMPENTSLHNYYISQDGKSMLASTNAPGTDYDANLYTLTDLSNGTIQAQFKYYPASGDYTSPTLSPDGATIAVPPTFDDGIVIMDLKGNVSHNLTGFNGKKFSNTVVWMPDKTLLCATADGLLRTNAAFTQASLVKAFTFADWGDVAASPDGTKIALKGGNHIWMMNADGSGLVQVTESTQVEALPVFSPDGKWLLVGTNYHQTGAFAYIWNLAILPADGKLYNVDQGADKNVVPVVPKGQSMVQAGDGRMFWR